MRVGVEVGGTFTDLVAVEGHRVVVTKVPSTPKSPDIGAFAALIASGIDLARIEDLGHGSTVATNAVLERKGAAVAFIATAGFRDLLFMQRHDRRNIYDLFYAKPAPPVRRKDCFEAPERLTADGSVDKALDEAAVRNTLIPALKAGGYRAVAICLLNAYANPLHEKRLAALIAEGIVRKHRPERDGLTTGRPATRYSLDAAARYELRPRGRSSVSRPPEPRLR